MPGPSKAVRFRQPPVPGALGLSDFTRLKGIEIGVNGQTLEHLLFHLRLVLSAWCHIKVVLGGERFTALAEG